jgi:type IV pilus assembly protein PilB
MTQNSEPAQLNGEELVKHEVITREELTNAQAREAATGTPWYRQLLQTKKMSFGVLEDILFREFHPRSIRDEHARLGQTLVNIKAITKEQLDHALSEQSRSGRLLGSILLDLHFITPQTITKALAKQYDIEAAELHTIQSAPEALEAVPKNVARDNLMLPLRLEGDKLTVFISHPQILHRMPKVGILLGKRIQPILTTSEDIRAEINLRYNSLKTSTTIAITTKSIEVQTSQTTKPSISQPASNTKVIEMSDTIKNKTESPSRSDQKRFEEIAREASGLPVMKLVSTIIEGAVNSGATDIHLDPQEPEMRVRYRIDGILHDVMSIPSEAQNAVVSRIKIMSDIDITETRHPQDGHISLEIGGQEFDIRVATLPTFLGERVVLRLLDQSTVLSGIKDLGLESEDEKILSRIIAQPYGMILVTGPTGSGKTTTLYAALNQKNVITDSIVTLEDPVEYQLSGINQVQIESDIDLTFANTLRAALRQDIDVLLVGEIRDADTARIAIRAAMTGHLVFSTLHTNDAPEAISTLRNMGIPSYLIASALTAIIGQRLVRVTCPNCKKEFKPQKNMLKAIGLPETTKSLYRGEGCELCYNTGCKGRTGIFEILEITSPIRKMIALDESTEKIAQAAKLKTLSDRCRLKVKQGITPPEEFLKTIRM